MDKVAVNGTIVRVIDNGGHSGGRPWRALVQNSITGNTTHISLSRSPDLEAGDSISFTGELRSGFIPFRVDGKRIDIPPQVILSDDNAYGRMELLKSNRLVHFSASDNSPVLSNLHTGGDNRVSVVRRSGKGSDPAVNWIVERYSQKEVADYRGPVIILDPAMCSGIKRSDDHKSELPFVVTAAVDYIKQSALAGRAGANTAFDMNDAMQRRWGVIIPRSMVHDPLSEWRGFVGVNYNLFPSRLLSPSSAFRITLAHEMAHVVQSRYGITSDMAECFADSAALMMFVIDGGEPEEARLYAHQRAAGIFQIPGIYTTGQACHAAITEALRMRARAFPEFPSSHCILEAAARITRRNLPPSAEDMEKALNQLPSRNVRDAIGGRMFEEWLKSLHEPLRTAFITGREGLLMCSLAAGTSKAAVSVLVSGWNDIAAHLENSGLGVLHDKLQRTLLESCERIMSYGGTPEAMSVLKTVASYRIPCPEKMSEVVLSDGTVVPGSPDSMTSLWETSVSERTDILRNSMREAAMSEEAAIRMCDAAMSLLLDADDRDSLPDDVFFDAQWAWAASLPENRYMLDSRNETDKRQWAGV